MKNLWPLLFLVSCGPYYVGAKPADVAEELLTARPAMPSEPTAVAPAVAVAPMAPVVAPAPVVEAAAASAAKVLAWDGSEVTSDDRPLHGLEKEVDTHSNLLSMYMDAKQSVDQLKLEVSSLGDLLAHQEALLAEKARALGAKDDAIARLEITQTQERADRADLEARLVTAQIRRLEAERQLLLNILGVDPNEIKDEADERTVPSVAQAAL